MKSGLRSILPACVLCGVVSVAVLAQYQVNNQLGGRNNQIYGGPNGSIRYGGSYTGTMMPSEARYEARKSGLMPSELRMNAHAAGPLASSNSYVNPSYRPAVSNPWGQQGLGSVRNSPPPGARAPATINPYLTSRSVFGR